MTKHKKLLLERRTWEARREQAVARNDEAARYQASIKIRQLDNQALQLCLQGTLSPAQYIYGD